MITPKCSGQMFLAVMIIVGFFLTMAWVLTHPIPQENHDAVVYMLGLVSLAIGSPIGYYFGSSVDRKVTTEEPAKKATADDPSKV